MKPYIDEGIRGEILHFIRGAGFETTGMTIEPLPGDASDRRYFKLRLNRTGEEGKTFVLMKILKDTRAKVSHEITRLEKVSELPFINLQRFYKRLGLPVPEIYHFDEGMGMMLLQDLGDETLEDLFKKLGYRGCRDIYKEAIEYLVTLQVKGKALLDPSCYAYHQSFDEELFLWEFNHFVENSIVRRLTIVPTPSEMQTMKSAFESIARVLANEPLYLNHRDYHSRNLMVQANRVGILDFQDSLLGPCQYDLASLLLDSYVDIPEDGVDELISFYLDLKDDMEGVKTDRKRFREVFDLQCIQRNMKAAGRFDYINLIKGNPNYLKYIPSTLKKVKRNLIKYPQLEPVRRVLSNYFDIFQ